jgi:hypothetical protein
MPFTFTLYEKKSTYCVNVATQIKNCVTFKIMIQRTFAGYL